MSQKEHFDYQEFKKRLGLATGTLSYHKTNGHIPQKTVYTQEDVDIFNSSYKKTKIPLKQNSDEINPREEKVISSGKTYTRKEMMTETGLSYKNFGNYIYRKIIPKKDLYTENELIKFKKRLDNRRIIHVIREKTNIHGKSTGQYNLKEFAEKIGTNLTNLNNWRARGIVPKKLIYDDMDVENYFNKKRPQLSTNEKTPLPVLKQTPVIEAITNNEDDPFETRTGVVVMGHANPYLDKLVERMANLQVYSNTNTAYIHVPASVYITTKKANNAFSAAKTIILSKYKALENSQYKISNKKNADNIYTHSQIIRIH